MRTRVAGIWRSLAGSLGRSSARIALTASAAVFRGNARRPDSISNNNTPTAKMSERWSIVSPHLLRRHVSDGPEDDARQRRRQQAQLASSFWGLSQLRESEVENLRALVCRNEDVRRFKSRWRIPS